MKRSLFYSILFCFSIIKCPSFPIPKTFVDRYDNTYYKYNVSEDNDKVIVYYRRYQKNVQFGESMSCFCRRIYDKNGQLIDTLYTDDDNIRDFRELDRSLQKFSDFVREREFERRMSREILLEKPAFVDMPNDESDLLKSYLDNFGTDSGSDSKKQNKDQDSSDRT